MAEGGQNEVAAEADGVAASLSQPARVGGQISYGEARGNVRAQDYGHDGHLWCYPLLFVILAFAKIPVLFLAPRFWAEEGSAYFQTFLHYSPAHALSYVYLGSFQGLSNLAVYLATLVPLTAAPAVTTYSCLTLQAFVAFQLGLFCQARKISYGVGVLLVAAWALLPQAYEVWATATNMQWVAGVSILLVLALPTQALNRGPFSWTGWALVCGLSGIPAVITAPLFIIRGVTERSRVALVIGAVLGLCACLQIAVMLNAPANALHGRHFITDPALLAAPIILQSLLSPLFGADLVSALGSWLRTDAHSIATLVLIVAGLVCAAALAFAVAKTTSDSLIAYVIVCAWGFVSLTQSVGALVEDPLLMFSGWFGGRYFLFGSVALCLMLALCSTSSHRALRYGGVIGLALVCHAGLIDRYTSPRLDVFLKGPSWADQLRQCPPQPKLCTLKVWPKEWTVTVAGAYALSPTANKTANTTATPSRYEGKVIQRSPAPQSAGPEAGWWYVAGGKRSWIADPKWLDAHNMVGTIPTQIPAAEFDAIPAEAAALQ